ncbi:MAG TPA: tyrosine-type recombinase/integrase, partial [Syntrophomonas sp.]|nr:tyrosine-type recombinase/integrase [Syntrophomonas sp.]
SNLLFQDVAEHRALIDIRLYQEESILHLLHLKPEQSLSYEDGSVYTKKARPQKIRFHDLRHSCASLLYANGVSLKEDPGVVGHSDISTTWNIYTHLDFSAKVASANAIIGVYPS